jgi:GGDEF domain-containing protein
MVLGERIEDALQPDEIIALRGSFSGTSAPLVPQLASLRDARVLMVASAVTAMIVVGIDSVPSWLAGGFAGAAVIFGGRWIVTLVHARRRERRMLESLNESGRCERALRAAGISGWVAWLASDAGRISYRVVEDDVVVGVPNDVLAEACRFAARYESATETALAGGRWLHLSEVSRTGVRLAVGLDQRPSAVERHLLEVLVAHLQPPARENLAEAPAAAENRADLPTRRAVLLIDLRVFEEIRLVAGQLVAERVVDDAERSLRKLLRSDDCVTRIGDDKLGVAALVPNEQSIDIMRERIATMLATIPVPHRALQITPQIVGAFGNEIESMPLLRALDEKLSPHARPWVMAS